MDRRNSKLQKGRQFQDDKLRSLEKKQASVISILRLECEKLETKTRQISPAQKSWRMRQLRTEYTFKLQRSSTASSATSDETFKYGWRVRSATKLPERTKEMSQRRSQMLQFGNFHSMNNKAASGKAAYNGLSTTKERSIASGKKEMMNKARELGNHYSKIFRKPQKSSTTFVTELDRYHRLLAKKKDLERRHRLNCIRQELTSPPLAATYVKTLEDIRRLEEDLRLKNRVEDGEFVVS